MWEVFYQQNPSTVVCRTHSKLVARLVSRFVKGTDYAREGEGWIS